MIDPEELGMAHLPEKLRREPERWANDDDERMAIYVLAYRRRARGVATRFALSASLSGLAVAWLMAMPWVAIAGLLGGPLVYAAAYWRMEGMLSNRLGVSRKAVSACVARFVASPEGSATAAMLERGEAQLRFEDDRRRS